MNNDKLLKELNLTVGIHPRHSLRYAYNFNKCRLVKGLATLIITKDTDIELGSALRLQLCIPVYYPSLYGLPQGTTTNTNLVINCK